MMVEQFSENGIYSRHNDFIPGRFSLVFIHGLSGSSSAWKYYGERLGNDYNLLFFDLRGHGRSSKYSNYSDYDLEKISADIFDLTKENNLNNILLVGHSYGCLLALDFLSRYKNAVNGAVFLSPNFKIRDIFLVKTLSPLFLVGGLLSSLPFGKRSGHHVDYSRYPNSGDWDARRMAADIGNTTIRVCLYYMKQIYDFDIARKTLSDIVAVPVLIIHGDRDTVLPLSYSIDLAKKLKNAKLVVLRNANHILAMNNAREVADEIEKFVKELALPGQRPRA
ncbi:MAG: alpha/beta hydrolase [Candidatus Paceibacterota bacterium]|jgi:pimeloyl-ACP methyl ester carboxylesterase